MSRKSFYEKANELIELAKKEKNPLIRQLRLTAAEKYYDADISEEMAKRPVLIKDILILLLFYAIISVPPIFYFSKLGFLRGSGAVIGTYALTTLIMCVILRMRGDISETSFRAMVREGFKAIHLLRKTDTRDN